MAHARGGISFTVCKGLPSNELADGEAWLRMPVVKRTVSRQLMIGRLKLFGYSKRDARFSSQRDENSVEFS